MDRVEEKRLVQAAQKGNADAFAALYRDNVQKIFRYVFYRVQDMQLAEDLTGDVFARALAGMARYDDRGRPFIAWLYRISHARVVDHYRKTGRRLPEENLDDLVMPVHQDMDANLVRQEAVRRLREAIATLTPDQQLVVVLRFIERQPIGEAARIMGKNPNAVKALQHRALRSLESYLRRSGFKIEDILAGLS